MVIALCYLLGLAAGGAAAVAHGDGQAAAIMLQWFLPLGVGLPLIVAFFGHSFGGVKAAQRLGWPPGSPFQTEVGIWDGAAGVIAVLAFWHHGGFWLATVIVHSLFWAGAGVVHVRDLIRGGNRRADNLLPALVNFWCP